MFTFDVSEAISCSVVVAGPVESEIYECYSSYLVASFE